MAKNGHDDSLLQASKMNFVDIPPFIYHRSIDYNSLVFNYSQYDIENQAKIQ